MFGRLSADGREGEQTHIASYDGRRQKAGNVICPVASGNCIDEWKIAVSSLIGRARPNQNRDERIIVIDQ